MNRDIPISGRQRYQCPLEWRFHDDQGGLEMYAVAEFWEVSFIVPVFEGGRLYDWVQWA